MNRVRFNRTRFNRRLLLTALPGTYWEAMRSYLLGLPELSALTDVYKNIPRRGWSYPYMVVSSISASDEVNNTADFLRTREFQFDVVSEDDIQAETLGEAAYTALLPVNKSKYPVLYFQGGIEVVRWPLYHGRLTGPPPNLRAVGNTNLWKYTFGYSIMTGQNTA